MPARANVSPDVSPVICCIAVYAPREPARAALRRAFPRRRARLVFARTSADFERVFRRELVDAAVLDVDHATDDTWRAAAFAHAFPSASFYGVAPYRGADGTAIARCAEHDFSDVLAEGVDDAVARDIVLHEAFTARFVRALRVAPAGLRLDSHLQCRTWEMVVAYGGRAVRTDRLARVLGVAREHLSRKFSEDGAPNLKRIIDLVRLVAAAELAKNPGYDVADVATVLRFASPSHLASLAARVAGTKPASLARLRTIDIVSRFTQGRERSRR